MSTGKHFLSKHRTITMLALFIKIETFHGFVIVLKAEQNLKRFPHFMRRIFFSGVFYSNTEMLLFCSIIKLPVDSMNNMETYLKVK